MAAKKSTSKATSKVSKDVATLLKADSVVLALTADKAGHIRVGARSLPDAAVVLADEVLVIRWENGQVVATRRKK